MAQDLDQLYKNGLAAIRAGDRSRARGMLEVVVKDDPTHEQAWLWLSAVVETDEERITCLENVLTLDPYNEEAQRAMEKLGRSLEIDTNAAGEPVPAPPEPQHDSPPLPKLEHAAAPVFVEMDKAATRRVPRQSEVMYGLMVIGMLTALVIAIVLILNSL